jgi:hypothetical protein
LAVDGCQEAEFGEGAGGVAKDGGAGVGGYSGYLSKYDGKKRALLLKLRGVRHFA